MFNSKKSPSRPNERGSLPRGRGSESGDSQPANPLARRFLTEGEPATVDLAEPGRFHALADDGEPETSETLSEAGAEQQGGRQQVISSDPKTGKFHVHPGSDEFPVFLGGERVTAATELRKGDCIKIGTAEFKFLS